MARGASCRAGEQVGPYVLERLLGTGGNAEVWEARNAGDNLVAVKVLWTRQATSEPYQRFKREVAQLRELGDFPGVLPLLDANVPARPSKDQRAWLAMPVAEPITDALGESPSLDEVVAVVAGVANTLAHLAEQGISHRDIKPANLYRYEGSWVIGDFGLVKAVDDAPLTGEAGEVGPRHYLAPEMLNHAATADGKPADVFSLAKTLWVLATKQRFPLPGQHRIDVPETCVSSFTSHPNAIYLDRLLERATSFNPSQRPSMRQVADELASWNIEPPRASSVDLRPVTDQIQAVMEPTERWEAARQGRLELASEAMSAFEAATAETFEALLNCGVPILQHPRADPSFAGDLMDNLVLPRLEHTLGKSIAVGRDVGPPLALEPIGMRPRPVYLWAGIGLKAASNGDVFLCAGYAMSVGRELRPRRPFWSEEEYWLPLGSVRQGHAIAKLSASLLENLPNALERLLERLRSP
jgi:serine/threonine protein kinase